MLASRGNLLHEEGRMEEALQSYQMAVQFRPRLAKQRYSPLCKDGIDIATSYLCFRLFFLYNNLQQHFSIGLYKIILLYLDKNGIALLPQPPYSPGLAPNDFYLNP
ncbi:hypothetical protein LAZ67_11000645 [Cordylochernes scorpioides]|uniref:Uncharacterized protein n=1 Tax=Cordylochernes scorpioides TaxID=51811 RepID=A0ABY6L1C2_9ARAC|nr:hypothetical protein LAZ67_11000645 [Cordylochernes scorpioides]